MEVTRPVSYTMSDYLGMLRRHWWVVLLASAAGVAFAGGITARQPRVYESSTAVLVHPAGNSDTNVVGGRTRGDINLDTEAQLVRSTAIAVEAARLLRVGTESHVLARRVSVEVPANTSVLVVRYSAGGPREAQAGAHAFAEAYLRNREGSAKAELAGQIATLDAKMKQLTTSVAQINGRLARTQRDSSERENLLSQRDTALNQINTLAGRLNQLSTATVSPGKIISDARLPARPAHPHLPLNLATGLMSGLLAGLAAGFARERLSRRIRVADDVRRRTGVPVLAELPRDYATGFEDVFPAHGATGRTFNRLRNEVLASLGPDQQVVVVTGASRGSGSTLVAVNLAAALARTGSEVVLVCAHLPDSMAGAASVTRILGVGALPGLSDVLAGRVGLPEALQRAPRCPPLRVITAGGTATAGGLLQSQVLRDMLDMLRGQAEYVVIEAPSTAASADAQSLAAVADAAVTVVELRRTRYPEIADAAEQLRRIGTPLLGAVVLPHLPPPPPPTPPPSPSPSPSAAVDVGRSTPVPEDAARVDRPTSSSNGSAPVDETVVFARLDPAATDRPGQ